MDVVASGYIADNNVIVVAKHPDRTIDFRGIDNHEINYVTSENADGVKLTTLGDYSFITSS